MEVVQPIRDKKKLERIKQFLRKQGSYGLRNLCLFVLGINSGLRIGDLLRFRIGDVSVNGKPKEFIERREQKTNKVKRFPLSRSVVDVLKEYLPTLADDPSAPLFPSRKGGRPITRVQAYTIINEAARLAGVKDRVGTHTLRKTFGYWAYQSGVDLTLIQALLNHASPKETLRYIGITQDQLDEVYLNLNL